jgi:hypothetical protein
MPPLDLFTVKAMALVTITIVSLVTLLASRVNTQVAGLRMFAFGLMMLATGSAAGISRLLIAGNFIVLACNILIMSGMVTLAQAIRRFRGLPPLSIAALLLLTAAIAPCYLYWLFIQANFPARVAIISFGMALLGLDASRSMIRRTAPQDRIVYWPTGIAFAFAAFYLTLRAIAACSGFYGASLFVPVPMETASTICADCAYIFCAFGMMLASNSQLRAEAEQRALYDPLTNLPNRRLLLERLLKRSGMLWPPVSSWA